MKVKLYCAWCKKLIRTVEWPEEDSANPITHGICHKCLMKIRFRAWKNKIKSKVEKILRMKKKEGE